MEKNSFRRNFPNFLKPREVNMDQNHSPSNPSSAEASVSVLSIETKEADPESSTNMDISTSENITSSSPHTSSFFKHSLSPASNALVPWKCTPSPVVRGLFFKQQQNNSPGESKPFQETSPWTRFLRDSPLDLYVSCGTPMIGGKLRTLSNHLFEFS